MERRTLIHYFFDIGIILRAFNGVLEFVSGILLLLLRHSSFARTLRLYLSAELSRDPDDALGTAVIHYMQGLSIATENFIIAYFIIHGLLNIVMVVELLRNRHWAYPFSITVIALFGCYELYRYSHTHALILLFLAMCDIVMIGLIWSEWRTKQKTRQRGQVREQEGQ